jgi:DNA-binding MarR family transcriptional regulator
MVSSDPPGFELPLRLLLGFHAIVDELHAELARQGHPELRPMHGFVFQTIMRTGGPQGSTASELGRALGVSKQAAGKTLDTLERLGYLRPAQDPADARRKLYTLTDRAVDALTRSERVFDQIRARWAVALGPDRLRIIEDGLRQMTQPDLFRLDIPNWFAGQ